jgi:CHAT domain-containing protein
MKLKPLLAGFAVLCVSIPTLADEPFGDKFRQLAVTARSVRAWLAAALACCCMAAGAHQFHFGITDVSFNAKTGSTEIVHTYMTDDIDALLSNLYQRQFDLTQPEDEAILRKYIEKQFWMQAADKKRLPIRWVGLRAGAESVVIYQEIENTPLSSTAAIHDEVLIDFIAGQVNTLTVHAADKMTSLTFDRKTADQGLR